MDLTTQPLYLFIKDLVTFLLTTTGIVIAGIGLSTWRKNIKGTKEFETAYNLHYSVLRLRDAIKHVRNPAIWNAENYKAIQHFKNKYPDKANNKDLEKNSNVFVYEMRWEEITNAYTEMESYLLAAEVLWGPEILEKIKNLKKKVAELNVALVQYLNPDQRTRRHDELFKIVYDVGNEDEKDAFSQEVSKAIEVIANYIKQKIK